MGAQSDTPSRRSDRDRAVAGLAARQHGVVAYGQLIGLGLSGSTIGRWVRADRLIRIHRGVYAVGHRALRAKGHWIAAVLACGPGAVLSHRSAAALWEIRPSRTAAVDVTVPTKAGRTGPPGLRLHRSGRLGAQDTTVRDGIPVTTVSRTLLDLADVLGRQHLKRAIDESEYLHLFDLRALEATVARNPGRRGATVLRLSRGPAERTRSALERVLLELVERHDLPRPRVGLEVAGYETDFCWPEQRLIVETDSISVHGRAANMEADRLRDRATLRAGYRTIRLTSAALEDQQAVVGDLRAALGDARS